MHIEIKANATAKRMQYGNNGGVFGDRRLPQEPECLFHNSTST